MSIQEPPRPLLGLLGRTLGHSYSKLMFDSVLPAAQETHRFQLFEMQAQDIPRLVSDFRAVPLGGFSVTVPYKIEIVRHLDSLQGDASVLGAVNSVSAREGTLTGHNTDSAAFQACIQEEAEGVSAALVLGAGGAAKAAVLALERLNVGRILVAARRREQVEEDPFLSSRARHIPFEKEALQECAVSCEVLVNATPVGMSPDDHSSPMNQGFNIGQLVYDMVYNPRPTRFLHLAAGIGAQAMDGLEMLARQAALSLELWTGQKVDFRLFLEPLF